MPFRPAFRREEEDVTDNLSVNHTRDNDSGDRFQLRQQSTQDEHKIIQLANV
jgi:hypothetical protein